jgi:hypothetical protein
MSSQTITNPAIVPPAGVDESVQVVEQEIRVYSHSTLFYWWPAWLLGLLIGLLNLSEDKLFSSNQQEQATSTVGLFYISVLLLLIIFTNVRLRGIKSVVVLLAIAFITVLLAWFGWWDKIVSLIPYLSVHMDSGFYLVFSTSLLIIWLLMFFIFDRMTFWRIRPGQLTVEHRIGGGAESFDTNALRFQKLSSDLFRAVLGLGTGDLQATGAPNGSALYMPNVTFAQRKVHAIERLIAVKPDFAS